MQIMTYDEYSKIEHSTPYMFKVEKDNKHLFYFGEAHSFDTKHPEWEILKKFWQEFVDVTDDKKRIVFVEGGIRPVLESEEKTILKHGGMGLITYLTSQHVIETFSPEPNDEYERTELLKSEFSKDEIQYYYFVRTIHQWGRKMDPKPDFEIYINKFLDNDKVSSGWSDYDFSLDHMKEIHKQLFNTEFDEKDHQFFSDIDSPTKHITVTNKIAATNIRDPYIIEQIKKYWDDGYSIFIQYGASHAVMQEPILKEIL